MHSPRRFAPISVAISFAAVLVFIVGATPVAAFSTSVGQSLVKSKCFAPVTWQGGMPGNSYIYPYSNEPHGTVYWCYYKYKISSIGPDGDYYAMDVVTHWTEAGSSLSYEEAIMRQAATSTTPTKDRVNGSTPTKTSTTSCSSPFTFSVSYAVFSVSVTPQFCSGYTVTRVSGGDNNGDTTATWQMNNAGKATTIETNFYQKVAHGVVPYFFANFQIPEYIYRYNSVGAPWTISRAWDYPSYSNI